MRHLALLSLGLVGGVALLSFDVWLGYASMRAGNPEEAIDGVHEPHPRLGWAPRPGSGCHRLRGNFEVRYGIESDGLRRVPASTAGGPTLWIFGDSFTFGHGVADEETWPSLLARDWLRPGHAVRNAGVMGYGLTQQVQRLRELAPRIQPGDRVLLAPLSVDFERSLAHFEHPSRSLLREEKGRIDAYPVLRDGRLEVAAFDTLANRARALLYNARLTGSGWRRLHHLLAPPRVAEEGAALLRYARAQSEGRGARFAWLLLPHPRECELGALRVDLSRLGAADLCPFFSGQADALRSLQFPDDAHWNARGHAVAARAVAVALVGQGFLDPQELQAEVPRPPARTGATGASGE